MEALRYNTGKFRMSLVPSSLNRYTAAGLTYGEKKYTVTDRKGKVLRTGANNWRNGFNWTSLIDSLERHVTAFKEGEDIDSESGLPHLCLMGCNIAFLTEHFDKGLGVDDRYHNTAQGKELVFREPPKWNQQNSNRSSKGSSASRKRKKASRMTSRTSTSRLRARASIRRSSRRS